MYRVIYGSDGKVFVGDWSSIPGLGRFPREGIGYSLQYSGLENSMDCTVHGVAESTQLSDFQFLNHGLNLHPQKGQYSLTTARLPGNS